MNASRQLIAAVFLFFILQPGLAAETLWKGAVLRDYIESLSRDGLRILYSSELVLDEYRVINEPTEADPASALRNALKPYNLTVVDGPAGSVVITELSKKSALGHGDLVVSVSSRSINVDGAQVAINGDPVGRTDGNGELQIRDLASGHYQLVVSADGYRQSPKSEFEVTRGSTTSVLVELLENAPLLSELIVTAAHYRLKYDNPQTQTFLDRELMSRLPNLGDETVRAISKLPGTTNGGASARHHIRGGEGNEVLFQLDGLRLYEPYHQKDFQSVITIVNQNAISGIDFYSGGYPARYGDRTSGVMDIGLREATGKTETELGLSFYDTSALSIGNFGDRQQGDWLISVRRGNLDVIIDLIDPDLGTPNYSDLLMHIGWQLGDTTRISGNFLASNDKISLFDVGSSGYANANYANRIFWLKSETRWNANLKVETLVSASNIENKRNGIADVEGILSGSVDDRRSFEDYSFKQDWQYALSDGWMLNAGFEYKDVRADYQYDSFSVTNSPFDDFLDNEAVVSRSLKLSPRGAQFAAYFETRWQPINRLTLDAGFRWDRQSYTLPEDDSHSSPRLSLLYRIGSGTEFRVSWGQFFQAQEINELQISDGLTEFFPAQRAIHVVASASHEFSRGFALRLELYRKSFRTLRPRFENLFDPIILIPELNYDRVRIDADSASASGAEVLLSSGDDHKALMWWLSYGWAEVEDTVAGTDVMRSWDQTHTVKAGLSWAGEKWSYSASASAHTGWPKTVLLTETVTNPDGTTELILSTTPRNSLRYSAFHTLDVRVSRQFEVSKGELTGFVEITNLYDRQNPCCTEYSSHTDASGIQFVQARQRNWLPILVALGVTWRF